MLKEIPKVGANVRCIEELPLLTVGKVYEVYALDYEDCALILDDDNDPNDPYDIGESNYHYFELAEETSDSVNSPAHYKRGELETIDIIAHIVAGYSDPFVAYSVGNAIKYADRAPYKHDDPAECLRKAVWYLTRAADHIDANREAKL